jgi:predicted ATPase
MASPYGFFLRAEMMHGYFAGIDADPTQARAWDGQRLQERSHGESFLAVLRHRFADVGVYFLDEPEAALSFRSCLGLLALLAQLREEGSQVAHRIGGAMIELGGPWVRLYPWTSQRRPAATKR